MLRLTSQREFARLPPLLLDRSSTFDPPFLLLKLISLLVKLFLHLRVSGVQLLLALFELVLLFLHLLLEDHLHLRLHLRKLLLVQTPLLFLFDRRVNFLENARILSDAHLSQFV